MKREMGQKDKEVSDLKHDIRTSKLREIEIEKLVFEDESKRLRIALEEMIMAANEREMEAAENP